MCVPAEYRRASLDLQVFTVAHVSAYAATYDMVETIISATVLKQVHEVPFSQAGNLKGTAGSQLSPHSATLNCGYHEVHVSLR